MLLADAACLALSRCLSYAMTPMVVLIEDTPCAVEKAIGSLLKEVAEGPGRKLLGSCKVPISLMMT